MFSPVVKQTWIVSSVLLNSVNQGLILSYPYCLLPALMADDSPIKIDLNTASWLASATALAFVFGLFAASFLMDRIGRRLSNAFMIVLGIISWIWTYFSTDVTTLMIGRVLGGISIIGGYTIGCCVMGEYSSPKYRGVFLNLKTATFCIGSMIMHIIGSNYNWGTVALMSMVPLILAFIVNCTWPESPSWLALKGKFKKSEISFFLLRGNNNESIKEFEAMIKAQKDRIANEPTQISLRARLIIFLKKFTLNSFTKPLIAYLSTTVLTEAGCRHIFPAFANIILEDVFEDKTKSFWYTMSIDIITVIGNTVSCILIKYFNRRTIIFSSGISCVLFLLSMSLYGFLEANNTISRESPWVMASLMILFFTVANFGITAIPIVLFGELFPLPHRETCMVVAGTVGSVFLFVILKVTPLLFATIHVYGTFAVLAVSIIISLVFVYFALPETKDRTLQEIEDYFTYGRFLNNNDYKIEEVDCDAAVMLNTSSDRGKDDSNRVL